MGGRQTRFILSRGRDEKEINEKWEEFKELVKTICREQLFKIHKEAPIKLEKILKNERVHLSGEETEGQEPEAFTRQYIVEPILKFLGYSIPREKTLKSPMGWRTPDYGVKIEEEKEIMIEAEPLASDLQQKGHGAKQVAEWLDRRSFGIDVGIATNGLEWILLKWDDVSKSIKEISRRNISKIFWYIYINSLYKSQQRIIEISEEEVKKIFADFYWDFSKSYIISTIKEKEKFLEEAKKAITKKFYNEFLKWVFGREERGKIVEKVTDECIIDKITMPNGGNETERRKFALIFMNRLIFIKFLEDKGIVDKGFLLKLYKNWEKAQLPSSFYKTFLQPLFYNVFNTKEEDRPDYIRNNPLYGKIPYLNGGLFRENLSKEKEYDIPDNYILKKTIDFLEEYDFTLSENGGEYEISPDILGYIYEKLINLLTSGGKKSMGAYYTPDEITRFISKNTIEPVVLEKIKKYCKEKLNWNEHDLASYSTLDEALNPNHPISHSPKVWEEILQEINNIKILDPACGSGHFLLSALQEMVHIKKRIHNLTGKEEVDLFKLKLDVIVNNLYGVDIDASAVEIAKLRLWLSLIENIKKEDIKVLPNIEYNIMEGNSLIGYAEKFVIGSGIEQENLWEDIKILEKLKKQYKVETDTQKIKEIKKKIDELNNKIRPVLNRTYHKSLYNRGIKIEYEDFLKLKPFHWSFEFYDIFAANENEERNEKGFDIIMGNPPYGDILSKEEKLICKSYSSYTGEIASLFVERFIPLNRKRGHLSYIITFAITFNTSLSETRKKIFENYEECLISTFDRDRCRFFDDMTQSVSILSCKEKNDDCKANFFTSKMFRTMPKLDEIKYQKANKYLLGEKVGVSFDEKHRLPKLGDIEIVNILKKITKSDKQIREVLVNEGEKIWIRTSGNYWYNAWDKKPYESTEISQINVLQNYYNFLIVLINSSLYYLWFRVYGDGRHMNRDIMEAFSIPSAPVIKKYDKVLSFVSQLLMEQLFANFDSQHNRFNTSNVKPFIDLCDIVLGKIYGLTKNEIKYILDFEKEIRGGNQIKNLEKLMEENKLLKSFKIYIDG